MPRNVARSLAAAATLIAALLTSAQPPASASIAPRVGTSIVSSAGVGATVKVTPATWPSAVSKRSFQWMLNGRAIAGKTASSLKLATSYLNKKITVRESIIFKNKSKATSTSNVLRVGVIAYSGVATLGFHDGDKTKLYVTLPTITTANATVSYAWQRGVSDIAGETAASHEITADDYGINLTASVIVRVKGYSTEQLFTNSVAITDPTTAGPGEKTLVWSQDFNGSAGAAPDSSIWTNDIGDGCSLGNCGWGNSEKEWYAADATKLDGNGNLVLTATKGSTQTCYYGKCTWQSGKLTTKSKLGFKYGFLEARIQGPVGKGTWPAFWMLGANYDEVAGQTTPWPNCGEIDIFETTGDNPNLNFGTPHSPDFHSGGTVAVQPGNGEAFHTYAIDWAPNRIAWYLDGVKYYQVTKAMYGDKPYPFNSEFYVLLDLAMGGAWPGDPASDLTTANMQVDYIKFYSVDGIGEVINH
jgi:beta-glucanase (GH16 family)